MDRCHICKRKLKGLKCVCGEEYTKKDGVLYRKNVFSRWLESLGKDDFKPEVDEKWVRSIRA